MIKLTATALVHSVGQIIDIPSKTGGQPFQKRDLILDDSWDKDGTHYANFVAIEFSGDAMQQLNGIYPGQRVNVEAYVNGREWNGKILNSIRGRSVQPIATPAYQQPPTAAYPQQQYQQQGFPQQGFPQQGFPQQSAPAPAPQGNPYQQQYQAPPQQYQQPQQYSQPQQYHQPGVPGTSDLPFST